MYTIHVQHINYEPVLYWAPRVLALLFTLFLGIFALDVFTGENPIWYELVGFWIHLIPNMIVLGVLLIAWKHEKLGGVLFLLFYIFAILPFGNPFLIGIALFSPLILIGGLFIMHQLMTELTKKGKRFIGR